LGDALARTAFCKQRDELRDSCVSDDLMDSALEASSDGSSTSLLELAYQALLGRAQLLTHARVFGDHADYRRDSTRRRRYGRHAFSDTANRTLRSDGERMLSGYSRNSMTGPLVLATDGVPVVTTGTPASTRRT